MTGVATLYLWLLRRRTDTVSLCLSDIPSFKIPHYPSSFWPRSQQVYQQAKEQGDKRNAFLISKCSGSVKIFFFVILLKPLLSPSCCSLWGYFPHGQRSFQQPWLSRPVSAQHGVCLDDSELPWQPAPAVLHVNALPGVIIQPFNRPKGRMLCVY